MDLPQRIDYLIKNLCYDNGKEFAVKAGLPITSVSKWRHGDRVPRQNALEKILAAFPEVRRDWLFYGKGKPLLGRVGAARPSDKKLLERLDALEKKMDDLLAMMEKYR